MSTEQMRTPEGSRRANPETLRLRRASPSLTVGDISTSLRFYRDTLGFVVDEIWEQEGRHVGAALVAGSVHLMLTLDDGAQGVDRRKGDGFRLHLTTVQDVDDLAGRVERRGGTLEAPPADVPWGGRSFTVVDPDGFRLTIASEA